MNIIKLFAIVLLSTLSLHGATYDDNYSVVASQKPTQKNDNTFMNGNFSEILRFDMLNFRNQKMEEKSQDELDKILKTINEYIQNKRDIKITVIGHTDKPTDDFNENKIDSGTYANSIENIFRYSLNENNSSTLSKDYATAIEKKLLDNNISQEIIFVEHRAGKDLAFSSAESEGRELSNRVMLTLYVEHISDIDSDRDGVFDRYDKCPNTPRHSKVDKRGCPIDSDGDGVIDYKDKCPKTPKGVSTDKRGCPLDLDEDGVADYRDKCLNTMRGFKVDPSGCPLKTTLKLNFKPRSDKIVAESLSQVKEFAEFMKEHKLYKAKIVGHTDSIGKAVINMELSQKRALSMKRALVREGIDISRLTTAGRGELDPIESNRTKEGRKANRRIEVELFY